MVAAIILGIIALLIIGTLFDGYFIVRTREAAILERLGKFEKVAHAGLHFKLPWVDRVRDKISLQVRQLDVLVETKTKDNVFVQIPVAVQYQVVEGREREAFYMLSNHEQQIIAYVQDNVRSSVANMNLDDSFSSKDTIAQNVAVSLRDNMAEYGWNFVNTLVTDIRPDSRVRESMNSINAAQREREAAIAQAEAEKIRVVKEAEGAAEARKLQGRGVAEQRKEIVEGIAAQYEMLRNAGVEESPEALMLVSQYLDAMVDVAAHSHTNVLYMPSNPNGMGDLFEGMRDVLMSTSALNAGSGDGGRDGRDGRTRPFPERVARPAGTSGAGASAGAQPPANATKVKQQVSDYVDAYGDKVAGAVEAAREPKSALEYFREMREELRERNDQA